MAKDFVGTWIKRAGGLSLWLFVLGGAFLIVLPQLPFLTERYSSWILASCVEIGKAFGVAGILGLAIDRALKNELVREAVSASLGYLLPERLKQELRWLYDQKILVQQIYTVRLEHFPEDSSVRVCGAYNRRIEN